MKTVTELAQQIADQGLEACCIWVSQFNYDDYSYQERLQAARRRPKPPSDKELALEALQFVDEKLKGHLPLHNHCNAIHTIRRAIEQLPD
jgi:hypothetical protein